MAGLNDWSTTAASNASVGSINWTEGQNASTVNNSAREMMADIAKAVDGTNAVNDTWTFCDPAAPTKEFRFDGGSVSAGAKIILTVQNLDGTIAYTSDIPDTSAFTTAGSISTYVTANALLQGTFSIFVPASAMLARATNGATYGTIETSTNNNLYDYVAFDTTTQEYVGFSLTMPKGWNEGTVTAALVWSHPAATAYTIDFDLAAVAVGDGDALDAAHGTPVSITDTGGTTDDVYRSANSSALTIAGTPAAEDTVSFELTRDVASDTLDVDARIHGVVINITYGANDA